jgi:hypothetical protein
MAGNEPDGFDGKAEQPFSPHAARSGNDWTLATLLAATLIVDAVIAAAVLHFAGASVGQLGAVIALVFLLAPAVMWMVIRLTWVPVSRRHPEQPALPGTVTRRFQSFSFGRMSRFSNCVQIAVDERHLHLRLPPPLSWFGRNISIPWEAMRNPKPGRGGSWIKASLDGRTVGGPAWCLRLIEAADS